MPLFSGYLFSLYLIWDVAPLYFRDWVDTRPLVEDLFGADGTRNPVWIFLLGLNRDGTYMLPEGLINLNSMMIMFVCFIVDYRAGHRALFSWRDVVITQEW